MNNDTAKGTMDDAMGRAKRQVGEWTGNTNTQAEGAAQQIKGKAEKVIGNVKDAVRDAQHGVQSDADRERQRKAEAERTHAVTHDNRR